MENNTKSWGILLPLIIFLGGTGFYNFYLGYQRKGLTQALITLAAIWLSYYWVNLLWIPVLIYIWAWAEGILLLSGKLAKDRAISSPDSKRRIWKILSAYLVLIIFLAGYWNFNNLFLWYTVNFNRNLTELTSPQVGWLAIRDLSGLSRCSSLQTINLPLNDIADLEALGNLKQLRILNLNGNQIKQITILAPTLQGLNLSHNQIRDLSNLKPLVNLTNLKLSFNQIADLKDLLNLEQLQELDLAYNQIQNLPDLSPLSSLTRLNLSHNQISQLEGLTSLSNLRELNLSGNQLDPAQIQELQKQLPHCQIKIKKRGL